MAGDKSFPGLLAKLSKKDLYNRDVLGRNILHLVILYNRSDLLRILLKNPEIRSIITKTDYENGWNCLHYIIYYKSLTCYRVLLDWLKANSPTNSLVLESNTLLFELICCKDRNKTTPLQLLDNDFKNLIWIPEYVDESDKFHVAYRCLTDIRSTDWWDSKRSGSDIYMLGSNLNNNLGVGDSNDRQVPSKLSIQPFKDTDDITYSPRFKSVKISKNHSIVLTRDGSLYSSGIGSRGRLGHGSESMANCYRFKKLAFFQENKIKDFDLSNDHTIAVTTDNEVYTWGLNNYSQLGTSGYTSTSSVNSVSRDFSEKFESIPRLVFTGEIRKLTSPIKGCSVSKIHSLIYTKNEIISWGLNVGQMGYKTTDSATIMDYKVSGILFKGQVQFQPKGVSLRDEIKLVTTSETVTCAVTVLNDIHIYYQNQHIKLPKIPVKGSPDRDFHLFTPTKLSRPHNIVKISMKSQENIAFLLDSGDIVSFQLTDTSKQVKYNYVWKSHDRDLKAVDFDVGCDGSVVLTTVNGLVFMKNTRNKNRSSFSEATIPSKNKFRRVDFMNKIARVSCDENFSSFGFIRDDIDLLPLKLHTNTYIKDIEYLSVLSSFDPYRKQNQLYGGKSLGSYTSDYVYPTGEEEDSEDEEEEVKQLKVDILYEKYSKKYSKSNKRVKARFTYEQVDDQALKCYVKSLNQEAFDSSFNEGKQYDSYMVIDEAKVGFHSRILMTRSPFFRKLSPGHTFYNEDGTVGGRMVENEMIFDTHINFRSVLIFIHFVYTNKVVSIWDDYPSSVHCPQDIKEVREGFEKLGRLFQIDVFKVQDKAYFRSMRSLLEIDQELGNLTVILADGEMKCSSFLLSCRSAFFETVLAERWNPESNVINFAQYSKCQFTIVLKHLYGYSDLDLFSDLRDDCDNIDEFISALLETMAIADELLLFQLKHLCQLAIKDFISLDNAIVLLILSCELDAYKIFLNCCWYIYNNLEIILLDQSILNIPINILLKLEAHIRMIQQYQKYDPIEPKQWSNGHALIQQFITNPSEYNEHFMSDAKGFLSFEPLLDVRVDYYREGSTRKHRKSSRKSSTVDITDELAEIRKAALVQKNNENAIADDFEVVTRRRKKTVDFSVQIPTPPNSAGSSTIDLRAPWVPKPAVPAQAVPAQATSMQYSTSVPPWNPKPVPLQTAQTAAPILGQAEAVKKTSKVKIGPRMSQKERKKQMKELSPPLQPPQQTPQPKFSWAEAKEVKKKPVNAGFPALRKPSINTEMANLTLSDVMLHESLKIEEAKERENQRKTLEEIQQEQQFARWWEEEAARVQKQMLLQQTKKNRKRK